MPPTVSENDVAQLAALLARHGITLSAQLLAVRDTAPPVAAPDAVLNTADAPLEAAVAGEPDVAAAAAPGEAIAADPEGAVAAGDDNGNEPTATVEQVHIRCAHCNNTLILDVQPLGSTGTGTIGKRWYAISVGRQIGVFYGTWETEFKHLVSGVPHWFARRFSNEADARAHFEYMDAAGRAWVHIAT
ncbi:hypothetical protein BDN71DRAFT_1427197 [Pleurotus eryngii]|uniref:Ribonuclease H1 N-terminal domain-containing protein n=1 Tax=Pleurotus eryngii TaxID=5323 RepID=A0A9P6A6D0_PLEER|nr:hypothetical protein BDN71DRAFT_1427197 [Pleurotus eryngii]